VTTSTRSPWAGSVGTGKAKHTAHMKTQLVTITPDYAKDLLRHNIANRPLSKRHVADLAREMAAGAWRETGDTIKLSDGLLLDGQHRLHAVVASGVPIKTLLVTGLNSEVFPAIDSLSRPRKPSDVLALAGGSNCTRVAAALVIVDNFKNGRWGRTETYSNQEILDLADKYQGVSNSVSVTCSARKIIPSSILGACHFLFSEKDAFEADKFVADLASGQNLSGEDPVFHLRERLLDNIRSKAKLSRQYVMALVIKAWNSRRKKKQIRTLRVREIGKNAEAFPEVM
jgi:hypothetical protein